VKHLDRICEWKARSVEHARQRSVSGRARERRRVADGPPGVVGDVGEAVGELESEGMVLMGTRDGGSEVEEEEGGFLAGCSEMRRRLKGIRSEGRR